MRRKNTNIKINRRWKILIILIIVFVNLYFYKTASAWLLRTYTVGSYAVGDGCLPYNDPWFPYNTHIGDAYNGINGIMSSGNILSLSWCEPRGWNNGCWVGETGYVATNGGRFVVNGINHGAGLWYDHDRDYLCSQWGACVLLDVQIVRDCFCDFAPGSYDSDYCIGDWYPSSCGPVECPGTKICYQDIGLRVWNGTQPVSIAVEPAGPVTSKLRIAKNGTIYGVVLVDIGDANDSKVHIWTSGGYKALRKL